MDFILPQNLNPTSSSDWTWIAHHIIINKPSTLQVFCLDLCAVGALFKMLSANEIPWFLHDGDEGPPPVLISDLVVILVNSLEATKKAATAVGNVIDAFRAKHLFIFFSYVDDETVKTSARLAFSNRLPQIAVMRLEDRAFFTVIPACRQPKVKRASKIKWPNLKKLDLTNCTLTVAANEVQPFMSIKGTSMVGLFEPFYDQIRSNLHFEPVLIPTHYTNVTPLLLSDSVDMGYAPLFFTPNVAVDLTFTYTTELVWCVPDSCVLGPTTYFLWKEFSVFTWVVLVASAFAFSITIRQLTLHSLSGAQSVLRVIATVAANSVKIPRGATRWAYMGWLLAVLVLSTCYQTVLHSLMAAPEVVHKIADADALMTSRVQLVCLPSTCPKMRAEATKTILKQLAHRAQEVSMDTGLKMVKEDQKTYGVYTSGFVCHSFFSKMKALYGHGATAVIIGLVGVPRWSWLAPALRRQVALAEDSGLAGFWFKRSLRKLSCSDRGGQMLQPITLGLLWPAILLFYAGFSTAFVIFIIEICWGWYKLRKFKNWRQYLASKLKYRN